ncbi:hypothetical protein [Candidatus Cyanaurora vandensis]|uniref:hypothetical protein n=1 Tax=Candidatus Cyanaurora vandensis TaxID=2714958 RepID=UPI002579F481|nr:hypothetical protein [Candidatus Cyanaurora vandensis]
MGVTKNASSELERPALREHTSQYLSKDGNLLLLGVPGSGRRQFIERAVTDIQGTVLYLDCLRATDRVRFVGLLAQSFLAGFGDYVAGLAWVGQHLPHNQVQIDPRTRQLNLVCTTTRTLEQDFLTLLDLPQAVARHRQQRVIVFLNNFVHLGSWDRDESWQAQLRRHLDELPDANYVLGYGLGSGPDLAITTDNNYEIVKLMPLETQLVARWFAAQGFVCTPPARELITRLVQGHLGTCVALARRLPVLALLTETEVRTALAHLLEDLSATFETLLRQLPAIQSRVLETLALDPTLHPQSNDYTQKHSLPRGGSLQGALTALVKKDLLYGPDSQGDDQIALAYQFCQPLLGLWIQQYLA